MPYVTFQNLDAEVVERFAGATIAKLADITGAPLEAFRFFAGGDRLVDSSGQPYVLVDISLYPRSSEQMQLIAETLAQAVQSSDDVATVVDVIFNNIAAPEYHYRNGQQYKP